MAIEHDAPWERWKALAERQNNPPRSGDANMSNVIIEIAKPLLKRYGGTPAATELVLMLVIYD